MADQTNNPLPEEKDETPSERDSQKQEPSSNSDPIEAAITDMDISDCSNATPLDQEETESEISPRKEAALECLHNVLETVIVIKDQAPSNNFDLHTIFPFINLPDSEYPFSETPSKPEKSKPDQACASQDQQTEPQHNNKGLTITPAEAKVDPKPKTKLYKLEVVQVSQDPEMEQLLKNPDFIITTVDPTAQTEASYASQDQKTGPQRNNKDFTVTRAEIIIGPTSKVYECKVARMTADQHMERLRNDPEFIITPVGAKTNPTPKTEVHEPEVVQMSQDQQTKPPHDDKGLINTPVEALVEPIFEIELSETEEACVSQVGKEQQAEADNTNLTAQKINTDTED